MGHDLSPLGSFSTSHPPSNTGPDFSPGPHCVQGPGPDPGLDHGPAPGHELSVHKGDVEREESYWFALQARPVGSTQTG